MSQTKKVHLWMREEVRPGEARSPLTPEDTKILLKQGYRITVEKSPQRIFDISEYENAGCEIAEASSWTNIQKEDPNETLFILGLKELPLENGATSNPSVKVPRLLPQRHIMFAHCFKDQQGWQDVMKRWTDANGELLDLEFLQLDNGRRIAAFGYAAGFAGMAAGLLEWCCQRQGKPLGSLSPYNNKEDLIAEVKQQLSNVGSLPTALVLGAKGRCGQGSVAMAKAAGIAKIVEWDIEETKAGGPFNQLLDVDILVNDIYLMGKIEPFLTKDMIINANKTRSLSVFVDVSCDVTNPNNPFPLGLKDVTSFVSPSVRIVEPSEGVKPLDVIAIDHLPTLIPRESSSDFSSYLVHHLKNLHLVDFSQNATSTHDGKQGTEETRVWTRARSLFKKKSEELSK